MAEGNRVTNEPASGRHARPEVLAPAGDMERLRMAVAYGADAVYLAGNQFGMRTFAGNFSPAELEEAVKLCAARGVLVNVTCNTMPRNGEVSRLPEWLEYLDSLRVNAVIVAEVGTLALAKRYAPHLDVHISTQASIVNFQCASAWYDLGAKRVILARELSLDEIREIRARTPMDLEIECFVHGAMCVSYSGRCLLSNYMTGRDSNRGACAQPCRYRYALVESCGADGAAVLSLRNKFAVGDELELVGPGVRPTAFTVPDMTDGGGLPLLEARKPEMKLHMRLPVPVPPLSLLRRRVQAQGAAQ